MSVYQYMLDLEAADKQRKGEPDPGFASFYLLLAIIIIVGAIIGSN